MPKALFSARRALSTRSDGELVELSRSGNRDAYAELWRRHASAGLAVARSHSPTLDADDLVSESFARIFKTIAAGGGPTSGFRPYLFTTIRNTAAGWGRARREVAVDDADLIEDPRFSEEAQLDALNGTLAMSAFRTLSPEWQEVLWYTEVEGLAPRELAPLLGLSANSAAALAYRAREGLRQAWIQAHLASVPADSECRWTIDHLGAYLRGKAQKRTRTRVDAHLETCAECSLAASEATDASRQVGLILLPLTAGIGGAIAYTAWLSTGGGVGAASAATAGTLGGASSAGSANTAGTAGAASAGTASGLPVLVGAGLVLCAVAVAGFALSSTIASTPSDQDVAAASGPSQPAVPPATATVAAPPPRPVVPAPTVAPVEPPAVDPAATPGVAASTPQAGGQPRPATVPTAPAKPKPTPTPTPTTSPTTPATPVPDAPVILSPSPSAPVLTDADVITVSGTALPGSSVTAAVDRSVFSTFPADATGSWTIRIPLAAYADGRHALTFVQKAAQGTSAASSLDVTIDRTPAAPVVIAVDTADGRYFPILSGTAQPGATVAISGPGGVGPVSVAADATGAWTSPPVTGLAAGTSTLTVTQTDQARRQSASSTVDVQLVAPALSIDWSWWPDHGPAVTATATGIPGADVELRVWGSIGWTTAALDADGRWSDRHLWLPLHGYFLGEVRYAGDGRVGPAAEAHAAD
ncbi:sigma-70 family RNA polymerase sigma factor [Leifsonia sp. Le1]|uniref:sigma-70 family RNA polymerase sigma factor n=1 Tax=Leifsonia sp. Le1 TaxID=3404918 RepID=UPI003EB922B6